MVQSKKRVYRDSWGFKIVETEERFAHKNGFIKNDGFRMVDEYDYMDIEDYILCKAVDDRLYKRLLTKTK